MSDKWMPSRPTCWKLFDAHPWLHKEEFDAWFDREIRSMFENAVEVYGTIGGKPFYRHQFGDLHSMYPEGTFCHTECLNDSTHKALLIKIEPTKEESAEDVLRDIVNAADSTGIIEYRGITPPPSLPLQKARAFLARKK